MLFSIREPDIGDKGAIVSILDRTANLTEEEKDCALELFDIYLDERADAEEGEGGEPEYLFFVAVEKDDVPRGFLCYGPAALSTGAVDIYWIVVDPDFRRKGVGVTLLQHTESALKKSGMRMMLVETSGLPTYRVACLFYKRHGFVEEARLKDYFKPGDDKLIYVKRI